jgi:sterol-4alpha-carboxylate 3-dehydrogenase (decarboxylating)
MSKAVADAAVQAANGDDLFTAVIRLPILYGKRGNNFMPQLVASVRKKEHKMEIDQNKKVFEFLYIDEAAKVHILAARALVNPEIATGVTGESFFISDGRPELFFDFARKCYAATGLPVTSSKVTVMPIAAMQLMAFAGEWAYTILTLGAKLPALRRDSIDHLDKGCC